MTARTSDRTTTLPAKEPVTVVAGPYGHPFHPILVTIPIGAWVSSFVLDIASRVAGNPAGLSRGAYWLVGIGILGALAAALFGLMDLLTIPRGTPAFKTGLTHMVLNLTTVGLFVASFLYRRSDGITDETENTAMVLSAIALVVLLVSGWLGGKLAYHSGLGVAADTTQAGGYR